MPQGHANASQQFWCAERLGEIVIGSVIQCVDLLAVLVSRGKNDDRCVQPLAQLLQHGLAVDVRQSQIKNDQIWRLLCGQLLRVTPGTTGTTGLGAASLGFRRTYG